MNIKQPTIDFLKMNITAGEYSDFIKKDPSIVYELSALLPSNKDVTSAEWSRFDMIGDIKDNNFDISKVIGLYGGLSAAMGRSFVYRMIYYIVSPYVTDIEFSTYYSDQFSFYIDALPSYIGGSEVDAFIDTIFLSIPKDLSKGKKVKFFKEELKKNFKCKYGKRPYWPQEPEWPADENGYPLIYVSQKRDGELYELTFEDPRNGSLRIVEDFL